MRGAAVAAAKTSRGLNRNDSERSETTQRFSVLALLVALLGAPVALAGESPVGKWNTVDDKTGKVESQVEMYMEGGKLFGKIVALSQPTDEKGQPKRCTKCTGDDKDKPIVGLVIIKGLNASGEKFKGGTITDPADGKVYAAEVWSEDAKLKVRGYLGVFYKTQTWGRGN